MASSTEDYLDSLLRQAMGIPDPEPEKKPEEDTSTLEREDVLAMADGLTGSNSAILGNVYDHNASFTNDGEIQMHAPASAQPAEPEIAAMQIPAEDMPDPDAPVAQSAVTAEVPMQDIGMPAQDMDMPTLLPEVEPESVTEPEPEPVAEPEPVMEPVEIPEGPVIEHDGSLDIIPEPEMMAEIEIPVVEEPALESVPEPEPVPEPAVEEVIPAAEEIPVVEEVPAVEEEIPAAEEEPVAEPVAEEPATEESAGGISIDDLDPNDNLKALDADTIAALFANANAEEPVAEPEPALDEVAPEEEITAAEEEIAVPEEEIPVAEEEIPASEEEIPAAEEEIPAADEEPVAEEPATEESAGGISIDDLDPNDNMKALDADTIAALFASANAEESADEPQPEESAADDGLLAGDDSGLEELEIPLDEAGEEPLMPDQEISDLLSTLGELSGETKEEEQAEPEGEPAPDESVSEDTASSSEGEGSDVDLGVDMFDTDLSAMLDNVTSSLDSGQAEESGVDDASLNDLLGSLDDGSGDLSDIGDLLNKDENSELVDPNTETAEALFASDSEEDLFDIDNVIDEESPKGKKKKKKKFSLFGKKKKDANVEVIGGDEEMLIDPELLDIPDESELKGKKPGFFASLFAKLFEEVEEDTGTAEGVEQSAVEIAQEGAAENEAILNELEGEEAAGDKKKKKKEKKKKEKKDKKGKDSGESEGGEGEGEEAAEDTKKKKKKEKKKKEKVPEIPGKKLPRKKVVAISLFCITIGIVITFLAFLIPYSQDIKKAKKFYSTGEYQKTYEYMRGHKLTSEDKILYNRTITLLRIKRPYDSYQNYMKMGLRMEALNALVQGVQMIDRYAEDAATLGIIDKYSKQSRLIYDELYNTFGVTVDKARSWIELEGSPEYTRALYDALLDKSGNREEQTDLFEDGGAEEDPVINAEENDL